MSDTPGDMAAKLEEWSRVPYQLRWMTADDLRAAASMLRELGEREKALREALEPFAKEAGDNWSAKVLQNELPLHIRLPDSTVEYKSRFSMADCTRAAKALEAK